jgi:hypothetical protein
MKRVQIKLSLKHETFLTEREDGVLYSLPIKRPNGTYFTRGRPIGTFGW